jgi:hypothetical protein
LSTIIDLWAFPVVVVLGIASALLKAGDSVGECGVQETALVNAEPVASLELSSGLDEFLLQLRHLLNVIQHHLVLLLLQLELELLSGEGSVLILSGDNWSSEADGGGGGQSGGLSNLSDGSSSLDSKSLIENSGWLEALNHLQKGIYWLSSSSWCLCGKIRSEDSIDRGLSLLGETSLSELGGGIPEEECCSKA